MTTFYSVVTGGSSGIGAAICQHLLAAGKAVINVDKMAPKLDPDPNYIFAKADLSQPEETRRAAADVFAKPKSDYTRALFAAAFNLEAAASSVVGQ